MKTASRSEKKAILEGLIDLFGQNRRWLLFFGTGTSCALDKRFGMPALAEHLKNVLGTEADWPQVASDLAAGRSLEQALTGVKLGQSTKVKIRDATGAYVARIDRSVRDDVILGRKQWVGSHLIRALVDRLPPRNPRLAVITANYDMLIEYACAAQGIRCTAGFLGELVRVWDWDGVQDSLHHCRRSRNVVRTNPLSRVELFKVHGSINRFTAANRQIECDLWTDAMPAGLERDVASPGDPKYEQYAFNIDTVSRASQAEDEAMAFAIAGYGFHDAHLHRRILARVQKQDCPLLVMTLDLPDAEIGELRNLGKRVWILVAPRTESGSYDELRTLIYMPGKAHPLVLDNEQLWKCDYFAKRILGG